MKGIQSLICCPGGKEEHVVFNPRQQNLLHQIALLDLQSRAVLDALEIGPAKAEAEVYTAVRLAANEGMAGIQAPTHLSDEQQKRGVYCSQINPGNLEAASWNGQYVLNLIEAGILPAWVSDLATEGKIYIANVAWRSVGSAQTGGRGGPSARVRQSLLKMAIFVRGWSRLQGMTKRGKADVRSAKRQHEAEVRQEGTERTPRDLHPRSGNPSLGDSDHALISGVPPHGAFAAAVSDSSSSDDADDDAMPAADTEAESKSAHGGLGANEHNDINSIASAIIAPLPKESKAPKKPKKATYAVSSISLCGAGAITFRRNKKDKSKPCGATVSYSAKNNTIEVCVRDIDAHGKRTVKGARLIYVVQGDAVKKWFCVPHLTALVLHLWSPIRFRTAPSATAAFQSNYLDEPTSDTIEAVKIPGASGSTELTVTFATSHGLERLVGNITGDLIGRRVLINSRMASAPGGAAVVLAAKVTDREGGKGGGAAAGDIRGGTGGSGAGSGGAGSDSGCNSAGGIRDGTECSDAARRGGAVAGDIRGGTTGSGAGSGGAGSNAGCNSADGIRDGTGCSDAACTAGSGSAGGPCGPAGINAAVETRGGTGDSAVGGAAGMEDPRHISWPSPPETFDLAAYEEHVHSKVFPHEDGSGAGKSIPAFSDGDEGLTVCEARMQMVMERHTRWLQGFASRWGRCACCLRWLVLKPRGDWTGRWCQLATEPQPGVPVSAADVDDSRPHVCDCPISIVEDHEHADAVQRMIEAALNDKEDPDLRMYFNGTSSALDRYRQLKDEGNSPQLEESDVAALPDDHAGSGTGDLGETEATCTAERCNRLLIRNGKLCVACRSRARSACKKLVSKFEGATLGHEAQEAYTAYKGSVHACPQRGPHQSHTTWLEVQELLEAAWKTHEKSSNATLVSHIHGE